MFCNHCGKPNEDNAIVCASCGLEIQKTEDAVIPQTPNTAKAEPNGIGNKVSGLGSSIDTDKIKSKLEGMDKKKLATYGGIAGGAFALIIALVLIIAVSASKVSLKKYMADELVFTGINGYGTADTSDLIDYQSLNQVILKKNISERDYYDYYYFGSTDIRDYLSYECTSENNGTLSNGDKVEIVVTINKDGIKNNKMFKKRISGSETQKFKFKVSGLTDGTAIDIFDAVESVKYDTTASYSQTSIELKEGYVREYGTNGINVKVEDDYIKVYGNDFNSFSIGLSIASDNFDENSATIKLRVNSEPDQYKDYGIVISEIEKDVNAKIISYPKDNKFTQEDINALNAREKAFAAEKFKDEKVTFTKAILFVDNQTPDTFIAYFYKNQEGKFYVIYYDYLKVTNTGRVYNIEETKLNIEGWWGYTAYDSIDEYKQNVKFDAEYNFVVS